MADRLTLDDDYIDLALSLGYVFTSPELDYDPCYLVGVKGKCYPVNLFNNVGFGGSDNNLMCVEDMIDWLERRGYEMSEFRMCPMRKKSNRLSKALYRHAEKRKKGVK